MNATVGEIEIELFGRGGTQHVSEAIFVAELVNHLRSIAGPAKVLIGIGKVMGARDVARSRSEDGQPQELKPTNKEFDAVLAVRLPSGGVHVLAIEHKSRRMLRATIRNSTVEIPGATGSARRIQLDGDIWTRRQILATQLEQLPELLSIKVYDKIQACLVLNCRSLELAPGSINDPGHWCAATQQEFLYSLKLLVQRGKQFRRTADGREIQLQGPLPATSWTAIEGWFNKEFGSSMRIAANIDFRTIHGASMELIEDHHRRAVLRADRGLPLTEACANVGSSDAGHLFLEDVLRALPGRDTTTCLWVRAARGDGKSTLAKSICAAQAAVFGPEVMVVLIDAAAISSGRPAEVLRENGWNPELLERIAAGRLTPLWIVDGWEGRPAERELVERLNLLSYGTDRPAHWIILSGKRPEPGYASYEIAPPRIDEIRACLPMPLHPVAHYLHSRRDAELLRRCGSEPCNNFYAPMLRAWRGLVGEATRLSETEAAARSMQLGKEIVDSLEADPVAMERGTRVSPGWFERSGMHEVHGVIEERSGGMVLCYPWNVLVAAQWQVSQTMDADLLADTRKALRCPLDALSLFRFQGLIDRLFEGLPQSELVRRVRTLVRDSTMCSWLGASLETWSQRWKSELWIDLRFYATLADLVESEGAALWSRVDAQGLEDRVIAHFQGERNQDDEFPVAKASVLDLARSLRDEWWGESIELHRRLRAGTIQVAGTERGGVIEWLQDFVLAELDARTLADASHSYRFSALLDSASRVAIALSTAKVLGAELRMPMVDSRGLALQYMVRWWAQARYCPEESDEIAWQDLVGLAGHHGAQFLGRALYVSTHNDDESPLAGLGNDVSIASRLQDDWEQVLDPGQVGRHAETLAHSFGSLQRLRERAAQAARDGNALLPQFGPFPEPAPDAAIVELLTKVVRSYLVDLANSRREAKFRFELSRFQETLAALSRRFPSFDVDAINREIRRREFDSLDPEEH